LFNSLRADEELSVKETCSRGKLPWFCTPSGRASSEIATGFGMRWKLSRPLFMAFNVIPMERTETMTPIMMASCCFQGVAPMR
jgi:hypothetical protein